LLVRTRLVREPGESVIPAIASGGEHGSQKGGVMDLVTLLIVILVVALILGVLGYGVRGRGL
jgi:hypothetical protein